MNQSKSSLRALPWLAGLLTAALGCAAVDPTAQPDSSRLKDIATSGAAADAADPSTDASGARQPLAADSDSSPSSADTGALAPKMPKPPNCPVLSNLPPDAAGNPPKNPAGCPADGLGNFETWVYDAWLHATPVWLGQVVDISEKPGKWYAIEDKTVWANTLEITFTLKVVTTLLPEIGLGTQTLTVTKPGCYPWIILPGASQWAKATFGEKQSKYCTNAFKDNNMLSGGQMLFFGLFPFFSRAVDLPGGVLPAAASKLSVDIPAAELKGKVDELLKL